MVGPVLLTQDLRKLPYVAPKEEFDEQALTRYPHGTGQTGAQPNSRISGFAYVQGLLKNMWRPTPTIPAPILTFEGGAAAQFCACAPPDSDGDVGPNHYVEAINSAFAVYNKTGTLLAGPITYNSFFAPLVGTPCQNQNDGDPFVIYDHVADRWVITDFAFASFPGTNFYECVGVSQSPDPVAGPWALYALLVDASNLDDYPKMALWNNPQPGGAYHINFNMFPTPTSFAGVKTFALDRGSMLSGGPANAISFLIPPAGLGDSYSLVAANFRTGSPPPAGRDEMLLAVDSPATGGVTLTQVKAWLFHVDFTTPANSTLGVGANHTPNTLITVSPFIDAFTDAAGFSIVPQQGTSSLIQTLGDKIMTPVVYHNIGGTESLWADQTVMVTYPGGPTAVRWYQFDVTGGTFPATPAQQQTFSNGGDGVWRFMPSIAVDQSGNTAIGFASSNTTLFPGIRYAGRLASDPPNDLSQGEAIMFTGAGSQTGTNGRWGDYSMTTIDPTDNMTFWTVGEYYANTSSFNWHTRIGAFNFQGGGQSPTPTPTATATPTGTPASCSWAAGPDLPSPDARSVGVFFPGNGKFYVMGGRDANNVELTNPFEYDPVANTWTTKSATYPDANTNNMACSVLTDSGTPYIYCVGGSNFASQTGSGRVFRYNPTTDTITSVSSNWPPGDSSILPGGFSVFNNTLVILGGFDIPNGIGSNQIWQFTPNPAGWVQKAAVLPVPLGYIPTTTIGSLIYTGGGADITGGVLTDTTNSFVYDPVADSINTIADIPRPTSNTRAVNFCNQMYVLGGGFTTPSNEVDIYDPVSNTWSLGVPFPTAGRNFAADTDGTNNIWKAGGYASDGATIIATTEIFNCPVSPCGSPSPTPTATATATATAGPRHTPTPRPRPTPPPRP